MGFAAPAVAHQAVVSAECNGLRNIIVNATQCMCSDKVSLTEVIHVTALKAVRILTILVALDSNVTVAAGALFKEY